MLQDREIILLFLSPALGIEPGSAGALHTGHVAHQRPPHCSRQYEHFIEMPVLSQ